VQLHVSAVVRLGSQDCALAGMALLLYAGSEGFTTGGFTVVEAFAGSAGLGGAGTSGPLLPQPASAARTKNNDNGRIKRRMVKFPENQ